MRSKQPSRILRNYKRFHGRNPDKVSHVNFTMPTGLTFLGAGIAIEYESDKLVPGRSRKLRPFRHEFGQGVKIYLHPNRKWILISGGKFRVTDWMRD